MTDSGKMLYNNSLKNFQRAIVDNLLTTFNDSYAGIHKMFSQIFLEEFKDSRHNPLLKNKIRNSRNNDAVSAGNITPYK